MYYNNCNICNNRPVQMAGGMTMTPPVQGQVPGMAYVPWQHWGDYYDPGKAFMRGTMFAVLDKPFTGGGCK